MDWDNARVFLAIYRAGSLRGAAATLGVDQATVGRRLIALEQSLGATLFLRTPRGYLATPAGELAFAMAEQMEGAAHELQRKLQGVDSRLSGTVRIATTDTMAQHFVIAAMRSLQLRHPDIRIVLSTSTTVSSLTRRETDLAVRNVRPDNPDLICRRLTSRKIGLYASADYLARRGEPVPGTGMAGHDIVVYQSAVMARHRERLCDEPCAQARVAMEVNSGMMLQHAVEAGIGIGELACHMAQASPLLRRIWPEREQQYEVYLVMHSDLHHSARVRAVADAIIAACAQ
jgi:DNA-binding transcriptional LysR family regulator